MPAMHPLKARFALTIVMVTLCLLRVPLSQAQIYQCSKNGQSSFQDHPCDVGTASAHPIKIREESGSHIIWSGLKYGMSADEIQQRVPGAQAAGGDFLVTGARELLSLDQVSMAGTTFSAEFFFIAGKFTSVNLSADPIVSNQENTVNFEKLCSVLRARYGAETRRKVDNEQWGLSADADWNTADGKVFASIVPTTADTSRLITGYVPAAR